MNNDLRKYLPNYITFLSLGFGLISIVLSIREHILLAGLSIIGSLMLDSLDGFSARKLNLESTFGLELDSLADMVCFGVAPIVLVSQHLHLQNRFSYWLLPFFLLLIWSGAFRLARFNLQPPKENSMGSSVGLTITLSGLIMTLMILSDLFQTGDDYPLAVIIGQILILCLLMASRIKFPSFSWFAPHWTLYILYSVIILILTMRFSVFNALWTFWLCILTASIIQHFIRIRWDMEAK